MDMMKVMFKHWSRGFLSLVFVSSCWCLLIEDGTYIIIMNLAQNVLSVLYKCVCVLQNCAKGDVELGVGIACAGGRKTCFQWQAMGFVSGF